MLKISVITAVYNAEKTVADTINSIISQDYPAIELVVIDGQSTDGTLNILHQFSAHIDTFVSEPDLGIYDALNKGIRNSTGDVIGFLHADDIFESNKILEKVAAAFDDPTIDAVYGDLLYVRKNNLNKVVRYWRAGEYGSRSLSWGWMPPHQTFYVRRSIYERLGMFNINYAISADYDSVLRFLFKTSIKTKYIPIIFLRMRLGGISNRAISTILKKSSEDYRVLKMNGVGGFLALCFKNLRKIHQFWTR